MARGSDLAVHPGLLSGGLFSGPSSDYFPGGRDQCGRPRRLKQDYRKLRPQQAVPSQRRDDEEDCRNTPHVRNQFSWVRLWRSGSRKVWPSLEALQSFLDLLEGTLDSSDPVVEPDRQERERRERRQEFESGRKRGVVYLRVPPLRTTPRARGRPPPHPPLSGLTRHRPGLVTGAWSLIGREFVPFAKLLLLGRRRRGAFGWRRRGVSRIHGGLPGRFLDLRLLPRHVPEASHRS